MSNSKSRKSRTVPTVVAFLALSTTMAVATVTTVSSAVELLASTALIVGGTNTSTPDDAYLERVRSQVVGPLYPGQDITYAGVTYPAESWPTTGPLDLSLGQSVQAGVASLEQAMADIGNDDLVIYGYSQGALVANLGKRKLAEQYPAGTDAPGIDFVLAGDPNLPNGGVNTRFWGLFLPLTGGGVYGPTPTDTQFDTVEINRQYDGVSDFPLYPINVVADLNAMLGFLYRHPGSIPDLGPDPSKFYVGTHGDTDYYFIPTQDLPLFDPLRAVGVPESLIDVFEPFFRVIVELGYDRSMPPWEPTPARLIPTLDPMTVAGDLLNAIPEGVNNIPAVVGPAAPLRIPAPLETAQPGVSQQTTPTSAKLTSDTDPATSAKTATEPGQATSTKAATEPDQDTSGTQTTNFNQATSTTVSTSQLANKTDMPSTHRPLKRDSLGDFDQPAREPLQGSNGLQPTSQATAVSDTAATAGSASAASSSPGSPSADSASGGSASGDSSSGGDGGSS